MVGLGGFEPPTSRLSGVRSNQTELQALMVFHTTGYQLMVDPTGFEPTTSWMQTRRSPS
jgi:hypothetical protein